MSITIATLIATVAPVVLKAAGDFVKENRAEVNAFLKQSKPAIHDVSKKLDSKLNDELHKYENDGWKKDKKG